MVLGPWVGCPPGFAVYWSFLQYIFPFVSKKDLKQIELLRRTHWELGELFRT